ncbi:hypothetical protein R3Q06_32775 [Rhodococcus erythropolis]|nr:hypothetical protein [Rhodococcus erythropolis]MDV6278241.1 hypothetical protein [Rhodococcus erythropolis]
MGVVLVAVEVADVDSDVLVGAGVVDDVAAVVVGASDVLLGTVVVS